MSSLAAGEGGILDKVHQAQAQLQSTLELLQQLDVSASSTFHHYHGQDRVLIYVGESYFIETKAARAIQIAQNKINFLEDRIAEYTESLQTRNHQYENPMQATDDGGLPVMDIHEELDEEGNIVGSSVEPARPMSLENMGALGQKLQEIQDGKTEPSPPNDPAPQKVIEYRPDRRDKPPSPEPRKSQKRSSKKAKPKSVSFAQEASVLDSTNRKSQQVTNFGPSESSNDISPRERLLDVNDIIEELENEQDSAFVIDEDDNTGSDLDYDDSEEEEEDEFGSTGGSFLPYQTLSLGKVSYSETPRESDSYKSPKIDLAQTSKAEATLEGLVAQRQNGAKGTIDAADQAASSTDQVPSGPGSSKPKVSRFKQQKSGGRAVEVDDQPRVSRGRPLQNTVMERDAPQAAPSPGPETEHLEYSDNDTGKDGYDEEMHRREVAREFHRMRSSFIQRQGGFTQDREEKEIEPVQESVERELQPKVSRFKAAKVNERGLMGDYAKS